MTSKPRRLTDLQERILYWRLDHPGAHLSECARALKCSYTAVFKTTKNAICVARIAGITAMVDRAKVMGIQERQERLSEIGRADLTDFVSVDGQPRLSKDIPNHRAAVEFEIETRTIGEEVQLTKRRVKLLNPLDAIDLLNKMTPGAYAPAQPAQTFIDKAIILKVVYDDPKRINDSSA